ncbi:MAG TPA: Rieske 2Fe-2S domain-containing protein [Acidimicrobiales bacterium]|nr:Rieske 2Fe-2S domain-containing protein [Acidimicrobiales bacterium]
MSLDDEREDRSGAEDHSDQGDSEDGARRDSEGHLAIASRNPQRTETGVGVAFIVATFAGIGLAVTYALGGQTQVEGVLLFFCLGGLGFGMTLWGKQLMPHGPFEQQRENLIGSEEDRAEFTAAFVRGEQAFGRRKLLLTFLGAGFAGLGAALVFPIRSLGPSPGRSLFETPWKAGSRLVTPDGKFVRLTDLEVGGIYTVFPEGHIGSDDAQTLLIRADSSPITTRKGRESWSPDGYLAFSKLCTHAGCPVGLYEHDRQQMLCPCHQSTFDVLAGCRPVFGPATRSLPQLPIMADGEGFLRAQSDFTEPVGPGFWNRS